MSQLLLFRPGRFLAPLAVVIAAAAVLATAQDRDSKDKGSLPGRGAESKERRREGSRFDGIGRFEVTGDRVAFYPGDQTESYRVLENLALERVSRVLGETREARQWNVSGVFMEYQGGNYLLLTRATVRVPDAKENGK